MRITELQVDGAEVQTVQRKLSDSARQHGTSSSYNYVLNRLLFHVILTDDTYIMQVNNSTNSTEDAALEDALAFPNDLYKQVTRASVSY